jgi:hypothetical protein
MRRFFCAKTGKNCVKLGSGGLLTPPDVRYNDAAEGVEEPFLFLGRKEGGVQIGPLWRPPEARAKEL